MKTFTGKASGKLVPYAGPRDQATVLGAPILACPTCSGTGRVVKDDELAEASRRAEELQQMSVTAMLALLRDEAQVLRLLPNDPKQALELAEKLGSLITSGAITFDEKAVRSDFFCRLRELKKKHGAHLSWETLRHAVVRLYPPLRDDFSHWRALRMVCQRAQPSQPGVYALRPSYVKGKGLTPLLERVEPAGEAMRTSIEEQDIRLLGKRLNGLGRKLSEASGQVGLDPWDVRILGLASEFLNESIQRRGVGHRNAVLIRRREQLLRLARPADVGAEGDG